MEDERIIGLLLQRSEEALEAVKTQYGSRATAIAMKILGNAQDAEEMVNDALHALWQRIPPEEPKHLWAYFSRIVRNLSCDRLDYRTAARRVQSCEVCLSELEGCLPAGETPEQTLEAQHIQEVINRFLDRQDPVNRIIFVRRYYYFDSCQEIAHRVGLRRGAVNTRLHRLRAELKTMLESEEIFV